MSPEVRTVLAAVALAAAALALWPGRGILARLRSSSRLRGRAIVEDALKHVWHENARDGYASIPSLAGALSIRTDQASSLVTRMEEAGLLHSSGGGFSLTEAGREYALQVIRAHRLWERYLADLTGVAEKAWHTRAERQEHALTPRETEALSARLGHPRFDPHGDPIPTARGQLPRQPSLTLRDLAPGSRARIVHLEDEPTEDYAQIVAAGLRVGMLVRVVEIRPERVVVRADGQDKSLPPILATQVGAIPLGDGLEEDAERSEKLAELRLGEEAEIIHISPSCRGLERRRLMDLGVVPGTRIEAIMRSPSGDPTAYRLRDTTIAIRRDQAQHIRIRRIHDMKEATA